MLQPAISSLTCQIIPSSQFYHIFQYDNLLPTISLSVISSNFSQFVCTGLSKTCKTIFFLAAFFFVLLRDSQKNEAISQSLKQNFIGSYTSTYAVIFAQRL